MKKILLITCLTMLAATDVIASEITGQISTNPNALVATSGQSAIIDQENNTDTKAKDKEIPVGSGLLPILLSQNQKKSTTSIKVLGLSANPDGTLLRGSKGRIYIIAGAIKKHLKNLKELKKYRGQAIYDVTDHELSQYSDRPYIDGELIREKGTHPIYVIAKNIKRLVSSLEELRAHYAGLEIGNISHEDMELY